MVKKKIKILKDIEEGEKSKGFEDFEDLEKHHKEGSLFKICSKCGRIFRTNPKRRNGFLKSVCDNCLEIIGEDRKIHKKKIIDGWRKKGYFVEEKI